MRVFSPLKEHAGFTFIEVMIVMAVLGILSGIGVIAFQDQAENARIAVVQDTVSKV